MRKMDSTLTFKVKSKMTVFYEQNDFYLSFQGKIQNDRMNKMISTLISKVNYEQHNDQGNAPKQD